MCISTQEKFRKELIKRDQTCILSGLCHEVCEAAHLVNKEWFKTCNKEHKFTQSNGILLNSNLHKEFDLHFWTIDLYRDNWESVREKIANEQLETYRCQIKLYPNGQKKKDTNRQLEIFNYLEKGIDIPTECLPFVVKRNEIYKNLYMNNKYTILDIDNVLKSEFKSISNKKKRKSRSKKLISSAIKKAAPTVSPKKKKTSRPVKAAVLKPKKKKRVRYTKIQRNLIDSWINDMEEYPDKVAITRFCSLHNLSATVFESRFVKLWNKKSINKSLTVL